jgi:hypothetical protein
MQQEEDSRFLYFAASEIKKAGHLAKSAVFAC